MIKENYCIFAISFVYFFLEITLYGIVQPIGLHRYWVVIPFLLYIFLQLYKKFEEKKKFIVFQLKYQIFWHFLCCTLLFVMKKYII